MKKLDRVSLRDALKQLVARLARSGLSNVQSYSVDSVRLASSRPSRQASAKLRLSQLIAGADSVFAHGTSSTERVWIIFRHRRPSKTEKSGFFYFSRVYYIDAARSAIRSPSCARGRLSQNCIKLL